VTALEERRQQAAKMAERITALQNVSPDTAYREGFKRAALCRSIKAEEEGKVFLSGEGAKGVLVVGLDALPPERREAFLSALTAEKARANEALLQLDGCRGHIRRNKAGTCWVIDLGAADGEVLYGWQTGPRETRFSGPRLPVTNGGGHWVGLLGGGLAIDAGKSPKGAAALERAQSCWREHGRTPLQQLRVRNAEIIRQGQLRVVRESAVSRAMGAMDIHPIEAARYRERWSQRAEEIGDCGDLEERLLAEMRAEQQAAADAEAARQLAEEEAERARQAKSEQERAEADAEVTAVCAALGLTADEYAAMSPKKQALARHKARLAGKI